MPPKVPPTYPAWLAVATPSVVNAITLAGTAKLDLADRSLVVHTGGTGSFTGGSYAGLSGKIAAGGKLDLADNKLIVTGQSIASVEALIASGRNGGAWNGSGIVTS